MSLKNFTEEDMVSPKYFADEFDAVSIAWLKDLIIYKCNGEDTKKI